MKLPATILFSVCIFQLAVADSDFEAMLEKLLDGTVPQVTAKTLAGEVDSVVLLDTRAREEFEISHLKNARWVGFKNFNIDEFDQLDRDTPIVVYCSVGKRSEMVGEKLEKAGFENIRNLRGGIFQWANEGRALVDADGPTKNVHPYNWKWGKWLAPNIPKKK